MQKDFCNTPKIGGKTLLGMADGCYQALSNDVHVIAMLAHRPTKPMFYH